MSRIGRVADEFKIPKAFYQLVCTDNDQSVAIPWGGRCVSIYCRDKDDRINFNSSSGSSTYFIAAGQSMDFKLPWVYNEDGNTHIHGRNNASGQEAVLMITSYWENT